VIQTFVTRFDAARPILLAKFSETHPEDYKSIVRTVIEAITTDQYNDDAPDPERIHEINDGEYQGTLVYVIAEKGYQPTTYYVVMVDYGSCSGCDTLERIRSYDDNPPTPEQANEYLTLGLHIVQKLKKLDDCDV